MSDNRLKSLADRINRLMDEREAIGADIRDIYAEAKGVGYIPKALRKVIARLRMDPDKLAEDDTLVELYEAALGPVGKAMEAVREGATWEEAGKATGVPRATLARAEAVSKRREMIPEASGAGEGGIRTHETRERLTDDAAVINHSTTSAADPVSACPRREKHSTGGREDEAPATPSVGAEAEGRATSNHIPSQHVGCDYKMVDDAPPPFLGDDPGEPPPFLKRRVA